MKTWELHVYLTGIALNDEIRAVLFKQRAICLRYTHVSVFIQLVIIATRQSNGSNKLHTLAAPLSRISALFHKWPELRKRPEAGLIIFILMCEQVQSSFSCTPQHLTHLLEVTRRAICVIYPYYCLLELPD